MESSKNRLTTVRPRSGGSFFTSRVCTACMRAGGVEDRERPRRGRGRRPRAGCVSCRSSPRRRPISTASAPSISRQQHPHLLARARSAGSCRRSRRGSAARGGRGRPARPAARRRGRPSSVSASRAARHGAAGEQHVVDQDHRAAVDAARRARSVSPERAHAAQAQVVAVQRDVERADRQRDAGEDLDARRPAGGPAARRGSGCRAARRRSRVLATCSMIWWAIRSVTRATSAAREHAAEPATGRRIGRAAGRGMRGTTGHERLLVRLTGRSFKGVERGTP